jgi:hypothetical protein
MQQRALARGRLDYEQYSVAPMVAARARVLGERAPGPPRFLLRVEGLAAAGDDELLAGHELLRAHDVPYLLAVAPQDARDALTRVRDGSVTIGLNGLGADADDVDAQLDRAHALLVGHGVAPDVFVPPAEELDAAHYPLLAKRFAVITGDAGTVPTLGWHPTPLWRGDAVYMPAYVSGARAALAAAQRLIRARAALWVPLVVRWPEESEGDLVALCHALRGYAREWDEFLAAVRASR